MVALSLVARLSMEGVELLKFVFLHEIKVTINAIVIMPGITSFAASDLEFDFIL